MNQLAVKAWDQVIGYLAWDDQRNESVFELDFDYQLAGFDLSPLVLDKRINKHYGRSIDGLFTGLPPVLADSLPDHFGNRVFKEWLEQNQFQEKDLNPVERLLYIGKRGMGALEYEPDISSGTVSNIDYDELATISQKIIQNKYEYKDFMANHQALTNILNIGSSIGGAQAKIVVAIHKQTGAIRAGDVLHEQADYDYFIVKLSCDTGTPWGREKTSVEYVYYLMAKKAGLLMEPCELIYSAEGVHFKTRRFDRSNNEKIHVQSFRALTGYDDKRMPFSYEQAFLVLERLQLRYADKEALFRQMVFNVASVNMDDHLKNIACTMTRDGQWKLSPAYDLTYPFDPYQQSLKFHKMTINHKSKNILLEDLLAVAKKVGIRNPKKTIRTVLSAVGEFDELIETLDVSERTQKAIKEAINEAVHRIHIS